MAPDVAADHGVRTEPGATGRTPSGRAHHLGRLARPDAAVPIWRQMVLLQFANLRRRSPRLRKRRARMAQEFANEIGADAYTPDAASAAQKAKELVA